MVTVAAQPSVPHGCRLSVTDDAQNDLQRRFQDLVEPHLGSLLRFARRRTATLSDAEDSVQEACLRAWMAFSELREETKVRAWLYRILRTVLSDGLMRDTRRLRLASTTPLDDVPEAELASDRDAVFSEVMARLSSEAVYEALAAIHADFAAPVELHDIDGLKYREIAEALDIPIGTVMSRISRGRVLLARAVAARRSGRLMSQPLVASPQVALEHG
jgi:RNA polymerase sigma-70 factor (ECF subfamily)